MKKLFQILCLALWAWSINAAASDLGSKVGVSGSLKEGAKTPSLYFSDNLDRDEEFEEGSEYKLLSLDDGDNVLSERQFNLKKQTLNITGGPGSNDGISKITLKVFFIYFDAAEKLHKVQLLKDGAIVKEILYKKSVRLKKQKK